MNFVTRAFKSLTEPSLPFNKDEKILVDGGNQPWDLYPGSMKANNASVSLFHYKIPEAGSMHQYEHPVAGKYLVQYENMVPGIVRYIETFPKRADPQQSSSGGNVASEAVNDPNVRHYVVTERVEPIDFNTCSLEFKKYILSTVYDTLCYVAMHFKQHIVSLNRGCIMRSCETGRVVLVGIDHVYEENSKSSAHIADLVRYFYTPEILPKDNRELTYDTYQFGLLVKDILPDARNVYIKLLSPTRPKITDVATKLDITDITDNEISEILGLLSNAATFTAVQLQNLRDKLEYAIENNTLDSGLVRGSVIPATINLNMEVMLVTNLHLVSALKLEKPLNDSDPIIAWLCSLYSSLDRFVRLQLLMALPGYIDVIDRTAFQQRIVPKLTLGFTDSSVEIKRASLSVCQCIVPKLSHKQLNSDLLRLLAKTLNDSDSEVRQQTIMVLYEISSSLSSPTIVYTALGKALKDPVALNREKALLYISKLDIPIADIVDKIIGPVTACIIDKDVKVAGAAWAITDTLLKKIKDASVAEGPSQLNESELDDEIKREHELNKSNDLPLVGDVDPEADDVNDKLEAWNWDDEGGDDIADDADAWDFE